MENIEQSPAGIILPGRLSGKPTASFWHTSWCRHFTERASLIVTQRTDASMGNGTLFVTIRGRLVWRRQSPSPSIGPNAPKDIFSMENSFKIANLEANFCWDAVRRQRLRHSSRSMGYYYGNSPSLWKRGIQGMADRTDNLRSTSWQPALAEIRAGREAASRARKYFARSHSAYDTPLLNRTRLIFVGAGGAAGVILACARAGFGEVVMVDPDVVSPSNIGTQDSNPKWTGKFKVEVLAEDIRAINPNSAVLSLRRRIESLDDDEFQILCRAPMRYGTEPLTVKSKRPRVLHPSRCILLGLTDNFAAQARCHRLGLQFGLPTICGQEYEEGRGAEITFTVPGVTPACHRCMTSSRYRAYLHEGYKNTVTSHGAPIFGAQMLNAALGHILLAIAHHGTNHARFGKMVARLRNRNLVLLRMDPDFDNFLGRPIFSRRLAGAAQPDAFFMLDSLFLKQTPDRGQSINRPVCPDCGGHGDLRLCHGAFHDTRIVRMHFPENGLAI